MGLDMYLDAEFYLSKYSPPEDEEMRQDIISRFNMQEFMSDNLDHVTVSFPIGYWRKANAIHSWFVENVQQGKDECQRSYVCPEKLEELKSLCEKELEDRSNPGQYLSTKSGFFFGSTEYDEWYYKDLEDTIQIVDRAIKISEEKTVHIYYQASW